MAQHNDNLQKWLAAAVAGIRFRPDRAAVEQELREHIEDKTADLMRIFPGMTEAEAEERALSGMGDPKELGKELARVHKPWLGYLWRASQALLGAAALAALFFVILQPSFFNQLKDNDQADWYDHRYYGIQPHEWAPPPGGGGGGLHFGSDPCRPVGGELDRPRGGNRPAVGERGIHPAPHRPLALEAPPRRQPGAGI